MKKNPDYKRQNPVLSFQLSAENVKLLRVQLARKNKFRGELSDIGNKAIAAYMKGVKA